ncbi:hypothetical protein E3E12_03115 [Formicincola oecophyllae]|uniref:Rhodanese domain-containing protein n=1 Tax=Formicincola oecophyllae TaxID=2558361 RepID=A0A4Y6UA98_9PROT|nr:rhodanese-like domain-containing protein [Formicincola oecophyllae]QDH13357.1 hypothetical protein E3E12_03115 [Formicincola oecophyllae]
MKELDVNQAWDVLHANPDSILVDVRTPGEWATTGVADLAGLGGAPQRLVCLPWPMGAATERDLQSFINALEKAVPKEVPVPVLFLCRSGVRSAAAAQLARQAGYGEAINVRGGFVNPHAPQQGWAAQGLPTQPARG